MRIKRSVNALKKRRKILKLAKGYYGCRRTNYRKARQAVMKSQQYAYIGRKQKKRNFRALWIVQLNAAARLNNLSYNRFIQGLKLLNLSLDRKTLAQLAQANNSAFSDICNKIHEVLKNNED